MQSCGRVERLMFVLSSLFINICINWFTLHLCLMLYCQLTTDPIIQYLYPGCRSKLLRYYQWTAATGSQSTMLVSCKTGSRWQANALLIHTDQTIDINILPKRNDNHGEPWSVWFLVVNHVLTWSAIKNHAQKHSLTT